jgi:hypothetical protein
MPLPPCARNRDLVGTKERASPGACRSSSILVVDQWSRCSVQAPQKPRVEREMETSSAMYSRARRLRCERLSRANSSHSFPRCCWKAARSLGLTARSCSGTTAPMPKLVDTRVTTLLEEASRPSTRGHTRRNVTQAELVTKLCATKSRAWFSPQDRSRAGCDSRTLSRHDRVLASSAGKRRGLTMNDLLVVVFDAHGDVDRWARVHTITGHLAIGGPFWDRKGWPEIFGEQTTLELDPRRESSSPDSRTGGPGGFCTLRSRDRSPRTARSRSSTTAPTSCSGGWITPWKSTATLSSPSTSTSRRPFTDSYSLLNVASIGAMQTGPPSRARPRSRSISPRSQSTPTNRPHQRTVTPAAEANLASARPSPFGHRARAM